ncbi:MAG: radical SAM protein [Deltaproteobacteria bacterium]|nr:radical SAM protein [Deltaproteobacteria bacterium]
MKVPQDCTTVSPGVPDNGSPTVILRDTLGAQPALPGASLARPRPTDRTPDGPIDREVGTLRRRAPVEVALVYPNTYRVAGSSLGFQVIYRALNADPGLACHRAVLPEQAQTGQRPPPVRSLEFAKPLADYDAILVSIAYELDVGNLAMLLEASGIAALARDRAPTAPPVVVGGPLTTSNVLPIGPIADLVVLGEADEAIDTVRGWLTEQPSRAALAQLARDVPGMWVPALHGDAVPGQLSVRGDRLPALGQWRSPDAEFGDMMLLEASRGCPRYCKFCVVRAPVAPMREPELDRVVQALDRPEYASAARVGFVGAAVSDWGPIKGALRAAIDRGKTFGISSLRADRLDEDDEFVDLLYAGGYRTMTVASDAASQRLRGKMAKGLRERHLMGAALQARRVGMRGFKMYVIVGLPDEGDADIAELVDFSLRLSTVTRTAITLSPFVPKLHTPLCDAPFEAEGSQSDKLRRIQAKLGRRVDVRFDSPKWAWIEYRLSQGGQATGEVAVEAARKGGAFAAWKAAFAELDARDPSEERRAAAAARSHSLWPVMGAR